MILAIILLFLYKIIINFLITFFTIEFKKYDNNLKYVNDIIKINCFFIDIPSLYNSKQKKIVSII